MERRDDGAGVSYLTRAGADGDRPLLLRAALQNRDWA